MHCVPHCVVPGLQAQLPDKHCKFPAQVTPQAPQLDSSSSTDAHAPAQSCWGAVQTGPELPLGPVTAAFPLTRHWPAWQDWPAAHLTSQPPQLFTSVVTLMQPALQLTVPLAQRHAPAWHTSDALHWFKQRPQLAASVEVSTQVSPHSVEGAEHVPEALGAVHAARSTSRQMYLGCIALDSTLLSGFCRRLDNDEAEEPLGKLCAYSVGKSSRCLTKGAA
jgi:hypothetical protein